MEDVTFVIMGATGDLAALKLIPAIYALARDGNVGKFAIIGCARSDVSIQELLSRGRAQIQQLDETVWQRLVESFYYMRVDFTKQEDFMQLGTKLSEIEKQQGLSGKRLFYLATLPQHFEAITHNLAASRIAYSTHKGWSKVLYEKPFGNDLQSAKRINELIRTVFDEQQIYRVDHYLGKELVGNIALLRFTNRILEPLWNKDHIDSVQIILDENFGIKNRGKFYDGYGAIKDILQNHALQILALLAMESPQMLTGNYIRDRKAAVLHTTKVTDIIRGQYHGYRQEPGVGADSQTETFFAARLMVDNERWKGVPFFIRAGKNLAKKQSIIHIRFKPVDCLLAKNCPVDTNYLTIRIFPDEGFSFEINAKSLHNEFDVTPIHMNFSHKSLHGPNTPESYEVILAEALRGEHALFVRNDEIEAQWSIVDAIPSSSLYTYEVGSNGPSELKAWEQKHKLSWKSN